MAEKKEKISTTAAAQRVARNDAMRKDYLRARYDLKTALEAGDTEKAAEARKRSEAVGEEFIRLNRGLVGAAKSFLIGTHREDHEAAALMGMWEAFVGTQPKDEDLVLGEDGEVTGFTGWDPSSSTFGTWSRSHVNGRVQRSVAQWEERFHGVSYSAFQKAPAVRAAATALREELGRAPKTEEIAKRAGVTTGTVDVIMSGAPVSLETPLGGDGTSVLGDLIEIEGSMEELDGGISLSEEGLAGLSSRLPVMELLIVALRTGVTGAEPCTVSRTSKVLGVGRGVINNVLNSKEGRARSHLSQSQL